ncbi:MAG: type II toxin-antitoxin system VapC family toxin [Thermoplasmatota archaeon]
MLYIDSNIFIFAAMDRTVLGKDCREVLERIQNQDLICASSFLTIDEVIWVLKRKMGKDNAVRITKASLSLPVRWIEIDRPKMTGMIEQFNGHNLDPRDCLHLSSMKTAGINTILSEDADFDRVKGIRRLSAEEMLKGTY